MKLRLISGVITSAVMMPSLVSALDLEHIDGDAAKEQMRDSGFLPKLSAFYGTDSNATRVKDNAVSDGYWRIQPEINYLANKGPNYLQLGVKGNLTRYKENTQFDEDDSLFGARGYIEPSAKIRLTGKALIEKQSLDVDEGIVAGNQELKNRERTSYTESRLTLSGEYGAKSARGLVSASIRADGREYDNNRDITHVFDRDRVGLGLRFGFKVAPRTRVNLRYQYDDFEYTDNQTTASNYQEQRLLFGMEFLQSAFWNGGFDVGVRSIDFENADRDDIENVQWDLNLTWKPLSYSSLTFLGGRQIGNGSSATEDDFEISWRHQWSNRVASRVYGALSIDDYEDRDRRDETTSVGGSLSYQFRRWLSWEMGVRNKSRSTSGVDSDDNSEYDRLTAEVGVSGSL